MIVGIGVDTVDIDRFVRKLERTPALLERLFTETERGLPTRSLAARFAAKEALIKALGGSDGVGWHDLEVVGGRGSAPAFTVSAALERALAVKAGGDPAPPAPGASASAGASVRASTFGISVRVHLSMTHDGGMATAFVILDQVENGAGQ